MMNEPKRKYLFWQLCTQNAFFKNAWVIFFGLASLAILELGLQAEKKTFNQLEQQLRALSQERNAAIAHQINLQWKINSQSDQSWIELTLMKVLGLVPEGQTKVFFTLYKE